MKESLIPSLVCPPCQKMPELVCLESQPFDSVPGNVGNGNQREIIAGILRCSCGRVYPIIDGVPRFLEGGLEAFPDFVNKNHNALAAVGIQNLQLPSGKPNGQDDYENIRKSFSQEWGIFDYDDDKTWGWSLEERKSVFLGDVNLRPEELVGKLMLDAGCGNGTLTAALSAFEMQIVGLDLNDGLGRAYENRKKYSENAERLVQYVQGNLVTPPLKQNTFDLVYSSGVIHHTPSSKITFDSLVPLTKTGGRLYVWVYGKRGILVRLFFSLGRLLKNSLSLKAVMKICRFLAPPYWLCTRFLNLLGIMRFRSRTTREITLDLFDAFAPRYNHYHSEAEVRSWFEEHGFINIRVSGVQKHGFGMHGDKK